MFTKRGKDYKEPIPNHPVAALLRRPNSWQTRYDFWQDAASTFVRWGRFFSYKSRGSTGPIRELVPIHPSSAELEQDDETYAVSVKVSEGNGKQREYPLSSFLYARGPARDYLTGDSPVKDVELAIALEIMAEQYGASFFQNGAMPLLMFKLMQGTAGFKTKEQEKEFVDAFQLALGGNNRHRAMLLPKGIEADHINVENDKAQFLETRKYQRTVICGAFGVPPQFSADLENAHYANIEQQDQDFTNNVILPVTGAFEAAMERDLLTDNDRRNGVVIRFNLDSILRAEFKDRQEGLWIQRQAGVISPNEWREHEGMNPLSEDDGGEDYLRPANMMVAGDEPEPQPEPSPIDESMSRFRVAVGQFTRKDDEK